MDSDDNESLNLPERPPSGQGESRHSDTCSPPSFSSPSIASSKGFSNTGPSISPRLQLSPSVVDKSARHGSSKRRLAQRLRQLAQLTEDGEVDEQMLESHLAQLERAQPPVQELQSSPGMSDEEAKNIVAEVARLEEELSTLISNLRARQEESEVSTLIIDRSFRLNLQHIQGLLIERAEGAAQRIIVLQDHTSQLYVTDAVYKGVC